MKTTHALARELLAQPDIACFHFDPSRAGMDDERDTSVSEPRVELVTAKESGAKQDFVIVHGDGGKPRDEPGAFAECVIDVLVGGGVVSKEKLEQAREIVRNMPD